MARRAVGQPLHSELVREPHRSLLTLVFPGRARDLLDGSQARLRRTMAIETPSHRERRDLVHARHLIDSSVTGDARDAVIDVNRVIEINEVG